MAVFGAAVVAVLLRLSAGQDGICDFTYDVEPERTYYINDTHLRETPTAKHCSWAGHCRLGYRCRLDCQLHLPDSPGCSADRLLISRSEGSKDYADKYCGPGSTRFVTFGQNISAGLTISSNSPGSNFSCQLMAKKVICSCGYKFLPNRWSRIAGGEGTGMYEFPMMAFAIYLSRKEVRGAVIIDKRHVLTVAHTVHVGTKNLFVFVGKHNVTDDSEKLVTQAIKVQRAIVHPQYNNSTRDYDIAILRLKKNIEFSDRVGAACLPFNFTSTSFTGSHVTLLGWGKLSENGSSSDVLQKVNSTVISEKECQATYPELSPRQFCTYSPGKDACQGDTGGPVLYTEPVTGMLFLLGIFSHGRGCGVEPAVHTRVTDHLDWIRRNTPGAEYCFIT